MPKDKKDDFEAASGDIADNAEEKVEAVAEEKENTENDNESAEEVQDDSLPFPNAVIVRQIKKGAPGKMVSSKVKVAMNQFLSEVVQNISKEMNSTRYSMVEMDDFMRATKPYRYAKELQIEKERVVRELESMRNEIESLIREFERKFAAVKADDFGVLGK